MSFLVEIITMTQEMNLEDGSMAHFLVLKLPSGVLVKALVSDESAQAVVYAKVNGTPPPEKEETLIFPSTIPMEKTNGSNGHPQPEFSDDGAMIFGGEAPTKQPPLPPQPAPTPQRQRVSRVEKDDLGYPIIRVQGGQDPGEVVGGHDLDEDGVGQV